MASIRDAIRAYRPELGLEDPVEVDEAMEFLAEKSGVEQEEIKKVLDAYSELAFWFLVRARPVPLPGVGHLRPVIDLDGTIHAAIDTAPELAERMSAPDEYRGTINRHENIGVSLERLAQMWNSANPDDKIVDFDPYQVPAG